MGRAPAKITRPNFNRCSMSRLHSFIGQIAEGNNLIELLQATPFGHLFTGPTIPLDMLALEYLRNRWDEHRCGFLINGVCLDFTVKEVSAILGLPDMGELVQFHQRTPDSSLYKVDFNGKIPRRQMIEDKMCTYVGPNSEILDEEKMKKLSILYLFCTFLFCGVYYTLDPLFVEYVDDVMNLSKYNWAEAIHRYLTHGITRSFSENTTSFAGCGILLCVWLYEHCPLWNDIKVEGVQPHLFRWAKMFAGRRATFEKNLEKLDNSQIIFDIEDAIQDDAAQDEGKQDSDSHNEEDHHVDSEEDAVVVHIEEDHPVDIEINAHVHTETVISVPVTFAKDINTELLEDSVGRHESEAAEELERLKAILQKTEEERNEFGHKCHHLESRLTEEKFKSRNALFENEVLKADITKLKNALEDIMARVRSLTEEKLSLEISCRNQIAEYESELKELKDSYEKKLNELMTAYEKLTEETEQELEWSDDDNPAEGGDDPEMGKGKRIRKASAALTSPYTEMDIKKKRVDVPPSKQLQEYIGRRDYCGHNLITYSQHQQINFHLEVPIDVVTIGDGCEVKKITLCGLLFGEIVQDNVIDAYACLLHNRSKRYVKQRKYLTFAYISGSCYQLDVARQYGMSHEYLNNFHRETLPNIKRIFRPIGRDQHWFLMYIEREQKHITYFNSLLQPTAADRSYVDGYIKLLNSHFNRQTEGLKCAADWDLMQYQKIWDANCPKQYESKDCGVFVMMYMDCICRKTKFDFSQADMPRLRAITSMELFRVCLESEYTEYEH